MSNLEESLKFAEKAIEYDSAGKKDAAIYYYGQAAEIILNAVKANILGIQFRSKAEEYINRAEILKRQETENNLKGQSKTDQQLDLERAEFLLYQALNEDEENNVCEAVELYIEAVDVCLKAKKNTDNVDLQKKLNTLAAKALERAEELKGVATQRKQANAADTQVKQGSTGGVTQDDNLHVPLSDLNLNTRKNNSSPSPSLPRKVTDGGSSYTKGELEVLRLTSVINGREYVPFMSVDLRERFAYPVPYSDKHGMLALAAKQKQKLAKWVRPDEFLEAPCVIDKIDSGTIKQTIISDCSFIASLAISARYERKYNKKLVTSIIYPQNKQGSPVYNPCGKYMIKLHINGVWRKIIIDDYFPMGQYGDLLCSYSQNRNELWVSLLEKAYMKVMGGYDFPGSNSNIDLHALTGWIPERISIRPNSADFNKDKVFDKIHDRYHKGDCLVTVATGQLSQADQDRAGLVECHAYAMLDVRKALGKRMFLLKNPWTHLRWKGRYSERDLPSWTEDLKKALNYNPLDAQQFDDGVFWIDYDSICHFFDVFYVNWNPALFNFTYGIHSCWQAGAGPVKDLYSISENPQYSLVAECDTSSAAVWILLTRHITDKNDFADNKEYITLLVYKNDGKKVYYPFDPPPYIDGTRINSPHYLCKILLNEKGVHRFTLVVSQYEKMNTIYYTLRAYATCEFKLSKIVDTYKFKKKETGEWKGRTAGGCGNNRETYKNNPIYQLNFEGYADENDLCIDLKGPKQYSVGFDVVQVSSKNNKSFARQTSGSYRPGFCVLCLENVPSGAYNIIPTTFLPNQEAPFFLTVQSSGSFSINRLQ